MIEKAKSVLSKRLILISGSHHVSLAHKVKDFLEKKTFQCISIAQEDQMDIWKIREEFSKCKWMLILIFDEMSECHLQLHQLRNTPEHLYSIFPIQLDDAPIPESVSHHQAYRLKSDGTNLEKLQSRLLEWLDNGDEAFQEEQDKINLCLHPLTYSKRIDGLKNLPRPAEMNTIITRIIEWDREGRSRFFAIEGEAASGKSHIATRLLLEQGDRIAAVHFINANDNLEQIIKNLAAQLSANLAQYRQTIIEELHKDIDSLDASSLFNALILSPLRRENPNRHYWVLLDGLETLNDSYHKNPLLEMLVQNREQLPGWLKIIVTHQPDSYIKMILRGLSETSVLPAPREGQDSYHLEDMPMVLENKAYRDERITSMQEKAADHLPIFISYGHDVHTDKVVALREALVKRGHKVWIDRQGIPLGSDWRRKIYDGIRQSQLFLAFLSNHSVKSEYCQTEIRIAIGAPEHLMPSLPIRLEDTPIPSMLGNFRQVDLRDWPSADDSAAFQRAISSLEEWIDDDCHRKFCEDMEELNHRLEPFSFEARLGELLNCPFVGREWLLKKIDKWDNGESRLFGIVGGPGFGKSIFAANLRALQPVKVVAAQFIEWNMPSLFTARRIIQSLAFQLAARMETYRTALLESLSAIQNLETLEEDELFERLLTHPLENVSSQETRWIILDALDEATGRDGHNPFVSTLVRNLEQLPKWLKIIVTTRPDGKILDMLEQYHLERFDTEEIATYQRRDMQEYILSELKVLVPEAEDSGNEAIAAALAKTGFTQKVLDALIDKSENMFLYLRIICQDIVNGKRKAEDICELPSGIDSIFAQYFNRQYSGTQQQFFQERMRPLLEMGAACLEEITVELLHDTAIANGLDFSFQDVDKALRTLGTLVEIRPDKRERHVFQFIHRHIWEWLASLPKETGYRIDGQAGHRMLANFSVDKIDDESYHDEANIAYALHYAVSHLIALNDSESLWKILCSVRPALFEAQWKCFGDYDSSLKDCAQAIAFYCSLGNGTIGVKELPRISRLMITYRSILERQKSGIRDLLCPDLQLKGALRILKQIDNAKVCFLVGCWLLARAAKQGWNADALITAMEQKCLGQLSSIKTSVFQDNDDLPFDQSDMSNYLPKRLGYAYYNFWNSRVLPYDEAAISYIDSIERKTSKNYDLFLNVYECLFIGFGPLGEALPYLTVGQFERILKIVNEREAREMILDAMSARTCKQQVAGALWHYEKLRHYAGIQFAPPIEREDFTDEEMTDFINGLLVHRICSDCGNSANTILEDFIGFDASSAFDAFRITELAYQSGQCDKALAYLFANAKNCEEKPLEFAVELCKYGEYEKAYNLFEKTIFPPGESIQSIIISGISAFGLFSAMVKNDMWDDLWNLVKGNPKILQIKLKELSIQEFDELLTRIMEKGRSDLAAEMFEIKFLLKKPSLESWCRIILAAPNMPSILNALSEQGALPGAMSSWSKRELQELWSNGCKQWFGKLKSAGQTSREEQLVNAIFGTINLESAAKLVLRPGVQQKIQMDYINCVFSSFEKKMESTLMPEELFEEIQKMLRILGENSGELREVLRPYTKKLLSWISKLDAKHIAELEFFKPSAPLYDYESSSDNEDSTHRPPKGPFENMLLFDTLDNENLNKCVQYLPVYQRNRLYCFICCGMVAETKAFLDGLELNNKDKSTWIMEEFGNLLNYHCLRRQNDAEYQWSAPDSAVDIIVLAKEYGNCYSVKMPDLLYPFREQGNIRKIAVMMMSMRENEINKNYASSVAPAIFWGSFLYKFIWLLSWNRFCEISEKKLHTGRKYGNLEIFARSLEKADDWPADWFDEAIAMADDIKPDELDALLCKLLQLAMQKGTTSQIRKVLSRLDATVLVNCIHELSVQEPVALYKALNDMDWSKNAIHRIMATQEWKLLPFDDLCTISSCMLNDDAFIKTWLNAMLAKLQNPDYTKATRAVIEFCPELDFSRGESEI